MLKINSKFLIFLGFIFFSIFHIASASSLILSPDSGTHHVGDAITVNVLVSSPNEAINAVSSKLNYTQDVLSLNSISKSGSMISIWAQEPTFSNASGTASFEGVSLGGYTGSGSVVVRLIFRAKSAGQGVITFSSGSVLANDGEGTNTLKNQNQATFNILPAEVVAPSNTSPKPTIKEVVKDVVTPKKDNPPANVNSVAPVIQYYVVGLGANDTALIIVWVLLLFFMIYLYLRYRFKIQKQLDEVKKITELSFEILKEDEKTKDSRTKRDLDGAEKVIIENIDEIEKM